MITKALVSDTKELYILECSIFSKEEFGLSLASFYYHIKNDLFVCKLDKKIVGYILWLKRKKYHRLYSLCVLDHFQGKGIASKLLEYSFDNLNFKSFTLEVKNNNFTAINLYKKYGFEIKSVLKSYYPNNTDGFKMVKKNIHFL